MRTGPRAPLTGMIRRGRWRGQAGAGAPVATTSEPGGTVARRRLGFWRRVAVAVILPVLKVMTRRTWSGTSNIPATGGVIIASTHMSHADPLIVAHFVYGVGRWPEFLAKSSLFTIPVLGRFLRA